MLKTKCTSHFVLMTRLIKLIEFQQLLNEVKHLEERSKCHLSLTDCLPLVIADIMNWNLGAILIQILHLCMSTCLETGLFLGHLYKPDIHARKKLTHTRPAISKNKKIC